MIKVTLSALILGLVLLLSSDLGRIPTRIQSPEASGEDVLFNTTLQGRARKAKAKGQTKVTFPEPTGVPTYVRGWEEVVSNYSVVVAKPVSATSVLLDPYNIGTFYKVRVVEDLSRADNSCCGAPDGLPAGLPAPGPGEMYVFAGGGTLTLDGVEVTQAGLFSEIQTSQPYLLFLAGKGSRQVGALTLGRSGIFKVGADGRLEPINGRPNNIKTLLDTRYGGSLGRLRSGLKGVSLLR